jgi:hypothetical protein
MEVVDAIAREPRGVKNGMPDWPNADVVMNKVEMLSKEDADKMVAAAKAAAPAAPVAPKAPVAPAAPAAPAKPQ